MKSYRVLQKAVAFLGAVFLMVLLATGMIPADQTDSRATLDFSSCRLIVLTEDPSIFSEDAPILSSYHGAFLLQFETKEQTEEAYQYYQDLADLVETDAGITICEGRTGEEGETMFMTIEENPFSLLEETVQDEIGTDDQITEDPAPYDIALIDTGAAGEHVAKAVSMIGDDPADYNGHGTRMAAFIAEENPDAEILSIKALGDDGRGQISAVYAAIEYAIQQKVKIISLSASALAATEESILKEVVKRAVEEGIIFVGSAGNDGSDAVHYVPGNIEAAIIVGACDGSGRRLSASNYGATVDYYIHAGSTSEAAARLSGRLSRETIETILGEWEEGFLFTRDAGDTIEEEAAYYQICADGSNFPETDFRASQTQKFYSVQGLGDNDLLYYTYVNSVWTPAYCIDHGKGNPDGNNYTYNTTTNNILGYIMRYGYDNTTWGLSWQEAQFLTQSAVFGALGVPLYEIADGQHASYWIWNHIWGDGTYSEGNAVGNIGHFQYAVNLLNQAKKNATSADAKYVNYWTPSTGTYQRMITPARSTTSVKVVKTTSAGTSCSSQLTGNQMYSQNFQGGQFKVWIYDTYLQTWGAAKVYETGNDGSFTISDLYVGDRVWAEEIKAPKGYLLPSGYQEITLAASNNPMTFRDAPAFAAGVPLIRKVTFFNGELQEDTVEGAVFRMDYFDNETCAGSPLRTWYFRTGSDGTFSYASDSLAEGYESDALYQDPSGQTNLPLGSIQLTETESPDGYIRYTGEIQAKIIQETNGGPAVFSWITESGGQIQLNADGTALIGDAELLVAVDKVDSSTGRSISGAHLQILEGEEVLLEWDTSGQERVIRNLLVPGKTYTIRETKAPNNYRLAEDILFQVGNDGAVTILTSNVDITTSAEGYPLIRMKDIKMIRMPASGSTERMTILLIGFLLFCGGAGTGACFLAKKKHPKAVKAVVAVGIVMLTFGILASPILAAGDLSIERREDEMHTYTAYQLFYGEIQEEGILWDARISKDIPYMFWDKIGVDPDHRAATEIAEWMAAQVASDTDGCFAVKVAKAVLAEKAIQPDGELASGEVVTLPDGYYLLVSEDAQPILCLIGNRDLLTIREKSDLPTVKKEIGEVVFDGMVTYRKVADSGRGKRVPYRITGTLPTNYNAFETYTYHIWDQFEKGLVLDPGSLEVTIQDAEGTVLKDVMDDAEEIWFSDTELYVGFENLKKIYPSYRQGDVLVVEYDAFLKKGFSVGADPNVNEAWIEYSRSPVFEGIGKSLPDECRLYSWELEFCKKAADSGKNLAGAGFTIQDEYGYYINHDGSLTDDEEDAYVWESDADGRILISGIDSGQYIVTEVMAPKGYLPVDEFSVFVEAEYLDKEKIILHADTIGLDTSLIQVDAKAGKIQIAVTDQPAPDAPKTGDHAQIGKYILGMSAAALAMAAGLAVLIRNVRRKKLRNQDRG